MEKPVNTAPLLELAELFGKDGVVHRDLNNLKDSIESLVITLGRKSGKPKEEEDTPPRTLAGDWKDFTQEIKNSLFDNPKKYFGMKQNVKKKEEEDLKKEAAEKNNLDEIDAKDASKVVDKDASTTILSDMVDVLNALKDDTTQLKIYDQIVELKKTINDLNSITSKTIEPNDEAAKQEDREKLAEAIARRLSEVMGGEDGSGFGFGADRNKKTDGPQKQPQGKGGAGKILGGAAALILGGAKAAAAVLGLNAVDQAFGMTGVNKEDGKELGEYPTEFDDIQQKQMEILGGFYSKLGTFTKHVLEPIENIVGMPEIEKLQRRKRIEGEFVLINEGIKNLDNNKDLTAEQKKSLLELEEQKQNIIKRSPKIESKSAVDTSQVTSASAEPAEPPPVSPAPTISVKPADVARAASEKPVAPAQYPGVQANENDALMKEELKPLDLLTVKPFVMPRAPDNVPVDQLKKLNDANSELKDVPSQSIDSPIVMSSNKTINNREINSLGDTITPYPMYATFDRWQDKRSWGYDHV